MKKMLAMTALALFSFSCSRHEEARVTPKTRPEEPNAHHLGTSPDQTAPAAWDYEPGTGQHARLLKHSGKEPGPPLPT